MQKMKVEIMMNDRKIGELILVMIPRIGETFNLCPEDFDKPNFEFPDSQYNVKNVTHLIYKGKHSIIIDL